MTHNQLPPGREPLRSDWFIEQLGASQQKVMSLTVENRKLKQRLVVIEDRADRLEALEGKITQAVAALNKAVYLLDPTEEEMTGKGAVYRIMVALAALKGEDRG